MEASSKEKERASHEIRVITIEARPCGLDPVGKVRCNVPYGLDCNSIDYPMILPERHEASGASWMRLG